MKLIRGVLVVSILLMAIPAVAQEKPLDQTAMMEMMERLGTPGEMHKKLDPFIGKFNVTATFWFAPGEEPISSTGTSESEWIMDGRYVAQRFEGDFMGSKFSGMGLYGYDNYKKEYISTWIDSMSTTLMITTGNVDGNTWTYTGMMDDPMIGTSTKVTEKIIIKDKDHHIMEMWYPGPDGKGFKSMEIQYTRVK